MGFSTILLCGHRPGKIEPASFICFPVGSVSLAFSSRQGPTRDIRTNLLRSPSCLWEKNVWQADSVVGLHRKCRHTRNCTDHTWFQILHILWWDTARYKTRERDADPKVHCKVRRPNCRWGLLRSSVDPTRHTMRWCELSGWGVSAVAKYIGEL
jgi:hypothetical protein